MVTSTPAGISCPSTCDQVIANGSVITLTATPASGASFDRWANANCPSSPTCSLTGPQSLAAFFRYPLTAGVTGIGSISQSGFACTRPSCSTSYLAGDPQTFQANPGSGYTFQGWTGDCSGTGSCTVYMNAPRTIGATFVVAT